MLLIIYDVLYKIYLIRQLKFCLIFYLSEIKFLHLYLSIGMHKQLFQNSSIKYQTLDQKDILKTLKKKEKEKKQNDK